MRPRPSSILWAERLGLTSAAFGAIREALIWTQRVALDGILLAALFTIVVPLLVALLVLAVTRLRSILALVVMFLLLVLAWLTTVKLGLTDGSAAFSIGAASLIFQTASLVLMLVPASWRYLRAR